MRPAFEQAVRLQNNDVESGACERALSPGGAFPMTNRQLVRVITAAVAVTAAYVLGTFLWHLTPASNVSVATPIVPALAMQFVACLGSVGAPVFLWARYRLVGPLAIAGIVLATWHVVVPFFANWDMAPIFYVGTYAPLYVFAYLLVGGLETFLRRRNGRKPAGS